LRDQLKASIDKWVPTVRAAGIKPESHFQRGRAARCRAARSQTSSLEAGALRFFASAVNETR
jgi:hypothetical protein